MEITYLEASNHTLRCQINESTRLAFFDFSPDLIVYLALLVLIFHPTRLANFPPYSFIWPYSFNWHLRVPTSKYWVDLEESLCNCQICITVFKYTVPLRPWTFPAEPPATVQSPLSKLVRLATEFEAPLCIAVKKLREKSLKSCMVCIKVA